LYDATAESNGEILTLYMFANDLDNLYIDFCGKNIKVPHNAATTMWNTIVGKENGLNTEILGGLTDKIFGEGEDAKSINDYINDFAGDFGEGWTLNTLINKVLGMTGLDLRSLLVNNWTLIGGILGGVKVDDIVDANGTINLLKVLKTEFVQTAFTSSMDTSEDGVTTYRASINSSIFNMVKGFMDDIKGGFNQAGTAILGSSSDISLLFTEKNDTIDSFSIQALLGGMTAALGNVPGVGNANIAPCVTLTITDLRVEKFDSTKNNITLANTYTEDIALNEKLSLEISGATLKAIDGFTDEDIKLNHKIDITVRGKADIINKENNGTKIAVYIDFDNERIATATFANGVLAGKLEGKLKDGVTIDGKLYKGFTAIVEFNFADKFYGLLDGLVPERWKPGYVEPPQPEHPAELA
ncbi:MAG: hypothetical protein K2M36_01550, partial [Clostridia bacterium]|nr:hypothetical protein [Clostridia bacterium]